MLRVTIFALPHFYFFVYKVIEVALIILHSDAYASSNPLAAYFSQCKIISALYIAKKSINLVRNWAY